MSFERAKNEKRKTPKAPTREDAGSRRAPRGALEGLAVSDVTTRLDELERRDANRSARAAENARARERRATRRRRRARARAEAASASLGSTRRDASLASVSEKLNSVARNVDDRLATMKLAVETELVAVMRTFETRLEAVETRVTHESALQKRVSRLEARLEEHMTSRVGAPPRSRARATRATRWSASASRGRFDVREPTFRISRRRSRRSRESTNTKARRRIPRDAPGASAGNRARRGAPDGARGVEHGAASLGGDGEREPAAVPRAAGRARGRGRRGTRRVRDALNASEGSTPARGVPVDRDTRGSLLPASTRREEATGSVGCLNHRGTPFRTRRRPDAGNER